MRAAISCAACLMRSWMDIIDSNVGLVAFVQFALWSATTSLSRILNSRETIFALAKALLLQQGWRYSRELFKVGNSSFALFRIFKLAFVYSAIKFA